MRGSVDALEKAGKTYQAHSLAQNEDKCLVSDGARRCDEEEANGNVEERDGANDSICVDESHLEERSCVARQ